MPNISKKNITINCLLEKQITYRNELIPKTKKGFFERFFLYKYLKDKKT